MDVILIESAAYTELKRRLVSLAGKMAEFDRKTAPPSPEKWLDAQQVCLALNISKRALQKYRDNGLIPYSRVGGKFFFREMDIERILQEGLK